MKSSYRLVVTGAAALLVFYFAWEWYLSPKARVERCLAGVADAAEAKDAPRLLTFISAEYSDFYNQDRETLAALLERSFQQIDRLNVTLEAVRAEVEGNRARASFDLTVVAQRGEERYILVGGPMQPEKLQAELGRESGEWKILSVTRKAASP